jgi:hypothetical protein
MLSSACVILTLSASALANVFITSPVASTNMVAGKPFNVTWQDDGQSPSLQSFGAASFAIFAGNSQQQTQLQPITGSVDVSTASSVMFTPLGSIGPNTDEYFIRIQSLALKDAAQPMYPALAFSARFTMSGMTGTFSPAVQAQIDGQSTAPIGGTAAPAASSASVPAVATSSVVTTSKASSASAAAGAAKTSAAASSSSANGANKLAGAGVAAFAGVAVAILSGVLC